MARGDHLGANPPVMSLRPWVPELPSSGSPHLRTVARVSEAPPKLGLQELVALILHRLLHSLPRRTELLRRETSAYLVEDLGDFLIADVAKQEIVGH